MRRVIALYAGICLASCATFHILFVNGFVPFSSINILLLLMAPLIYRLPIKTIVAIVFMAWLVLCPAFILFYNTDVPSAMISVLILSGYMFGIVRGRRITDKASRSWKGELAKIEHGKKALSSEFENMVALENRIREEETQIVGLYEITKKLSGSLRFEEIFNILASFLKDNFAFRKCELAILKWEDKTPRVSRAYHTWRDRRESDFDYRINYDNLIRLLSEDSEVKYITRVANKDIFREVGVEDDEVESFIAVPLISEKKIAALLTIDNICNSDLEKFTIVASQFALEIRKVLLYERVEELAITDGLTALFVRRYFLGRLTEELYRSSRHDYKFAFLMIDIDDFKKCNDTFGHLVGDVILKEVARMLKESVREIDLVSRYGGEEFALVLTETGRDGARVVAERIRARIEGNVFKAYDEKLKITVSTGISIYPDDASEIKGLIEKSDAALYVAKRSGKNIICEYKK